MNAALKTVTAVHPLPANNLAAQYDLNGNAQDASRNGRHLTLGSLTAAPAWGASGGLTFDGTDDIASASITLPVTALTLVAVLSVNRASVNNDRLLALGSGGLNNRVNLSCPTGGKTVQWGAANAAGAVMASADIPGGSTPFLVVATLTSAGVTIAQDNGSTVTGSGGLGSYAFTALDLGNSSTALGVSRPANTTIHALAIWDRALTASELARATAYFRRTLARRGVSVP
jgi:hypothetical protein